MLAPQSGQGGSQVLETARRLVVSGSLGALVALGCGGEQTEPAPAEIPAAPSEAPAPPVAVEEVWSTTLPENFPQDVPQYPAAEVVKARMVEESGVSAGWSTADAPDKVASFYSDSFAAQGWSTQRIDGPDGILIFADKEKRSASIGVTTSEGKTQIDLLLVEMP
jgi:hypothetical protein